MRGITLENTEIKFLNIQNAEFFSTMTLLFSSETRSRKELMDRKQICDCQGLKEGASGKQLLHRSIPMGFLFEVVKRWEVESSDDCTVPGMYLVPLNCTF